MGTTGNCDKCGSANVVPRVRVIDRGDSGSLQVALARKPDGPVFQREERVDMYARVCGECGAVALFVEDPQAVYEAHLSCLKASDRSGA
jgi:hypothetical protein